MGNNYPTLIDAIEGRNSTTRCEIAGRWYAAKPYDLPYYSLGHTLRRLFHVWLILRGKAMAVQFAQAHHYPSRPKGGSDE